MSRCLCCGKELRTENEYGWHSSCIKSFFGTKAFPDIDVSKDVLNQIAIDNTNKGEDARYWKETFLQITSIQDGYYNTSNALNLCRTYVAKELPKHFEVQLADQIDILNRSMAFFKDNDHFNMKEFTNEVIAQPEVIESFNQYKSTYEAEHEVYIADDFAISDSAVKKQSRSFKSVIKLDKNFHIYIHGDRKLIEQGEDEKGRYYKVYFKEEQ